MRIHTTRNYGLFISDKDNRVITEQDLRRLKLLRESMKLFGYRPEYPMVVFRVRERLKIKDGQHRFTIAEELKLTLTYVEIDRDDIPISQIACTQSPWNVRDYVASAAARGKEAFEELLAFASEHRMPLSRAASLLNGECASSGNVGNRIKDGSFTVKDRPFADRVAKIARVVEGIVPWAMSSASLGAISRFVRVPSFDDEQFMNRVMAHPHLLRKQPIMEMYSEMYDTIYNFSSRTKIPLSFLAKEAAAGRSAAPKKVA